MKKEDALNKCIDNFIMNLNEEEFNKLIDLTDDKKAKSYIHSICKTSNYWESEIIEYCQEKLNYIREQAELNKDKFKDAKKIYKDSKKKETKTKEQNDEDRNILIACNMFGKLCVDMQENKIQDEKTVNLLKLLLSDDVENCLNVGDKSHQILIKHLYAKTYNTDKYVYNDGKKDLVFPFKTLFNK